MKLERNKMSTRFINNYIQQILTENDAVEEGDAPIPPHQQAAQARHPGTPEESLKRLGSHIDTLTSAIADYQSDRTAFHAVHGEDHPEADKLHDFMKHVLKTGQEQIDQPLSLKRSEIDRFRE